MEEYTPLIKRFVINLLLNKILCAAFGAWPSRLPPSFPSMSHLNIIKNLGSGLDPLPPFGVNVPHFCLFLFFEGIPKQITAFAVEIQSKEAGASLGQA